MMAVAESTLNYEAYPHVYDVDPVTSLVVPVPMADEEPPIMPPGALQKNTVDLLLCS
jgi:hypothetical protein